MSAQHTPEPWDHQNCTVFALDERRCVNRFSALVQGGIVRLGANVTFGTPTVRTSDAELEANARRIVECVNACEGIADPSVVPEMVEALKEAVDAEWENRDTEGFPADWLGAAISVLAKAGVA